MRGFPISVCFPFAGDEIGGSHISAIKLIEALDPDLVRPLVVLHFPDGPLAAYLREHRLQFIPAPVGPLPPRALQENGKIAARSGMFTYTLRAIAPLTRFLRGGGIDLVHTNDGRIHALWTLPARLAGLDHVWHHRGDPDARGVNWLAPLLASHIVTVSRFARPRRPVINVARRLSVIHSPFDTPEAAGDRQAARAMLIKTLGCSEETRFLGFFGVLTERKRPLRFVEAVAAFVQRHPDTPIVGLLFGTAAAEAPEIEKAIVMHAEALGIGDRIWLMGFRNPVEPWMQAVDVLLVPAVREPFGRTLIEAMFLGTPVVATNDGGNPEAIENGVTGVLIPPEQPESFVDPVQKLLTDPEFRRRVTGAAREVAHVSYSVETHVRKLMVVYRDLMRKHRRSGGPQRDIARRTVP